MLKKWRSSKPFRLVFTLLVVIILVMGGLGLYFAPTISNSDRLEAENSKTFSCNNTAMTEAQIAAYRNLTMANFESLVSQRHLTPAAICALPAGELKDELEELSPAKPAEQDKDAKEGKEAKDGEEEENDGDSPPKPDGPQELVDWELSRQRDAKGQIPPDGLTKAVAQAKLLPKAQGGFFPNAGGVTPGSWQWVGPGNIGGRIRALVINPTNPSIMYVGSVAGGVWKTTDGGTTWSILTDFLPNMAVSSLAMDPTDPNIIYAGTGEGFFNGDAIQGNGIFKTTDGGANWSQLSATNNANFYYVNRLSISPADHTILLAATRTRIFRSTDSGATWNSVRSAPNPYGVFQVIFNPTDGTKAVASGTFGAALYSTDSGQTWTPATTSWQANDFYNRVELAYARSDTTIVYASVYNTSSGSQIWKSTNGGQTYTQVTTNVTGVLSGQSWYDNSIAVDPLDANKVFWAGLDIYRSINGGTTFTKISDWNLAPTLSAHADHHGTFFPPNYDGTTVKRAYFVNDGGIYSTNDVNTVTASSGWINLNHNLGITQFYGGAGNPTSGKIVAGAQDNGSLVYSGNAQAWTSMFGGDGGFSAADPTDPNYFYGEYVYLQIHRSTNAGASSNYIYSSGLSDAGISSNANFIAPFILDPNDPNIMYGGGTTLWRTTNVKAGSPTWLAIPNFQPIASCNNTSPRSCISAIAVATGNSDIIWVGSSNGKIWYTTNATAASPTWTRVDTNMPGGSPGRAVNRITIDPSNYKLVYVSLGGFTTGNLYQTNNLGVTGSWTNVTGTGANKLPNVPIYSMTIHPQNSNWLYVGTTIGLFASDDGGANWQVAPNDGPSNTAINELTWVGNTTTLLSVTHGRGVFKTDIPVCPLTTNVTTNANSGCGSLRVALTQATSGSNITFANGITSITVTSPLPYVPSGVTITGSCSSGPDVVIDGTGVTGDGLKLLGKNTLFGIEIKGFIGRQLLIPAPSVDKNKFTCVVASRI